MAIHDGSILHAGTPLTRQVQHCVDAAVVAVDMAALALGTTALGTGPSLITCQLLSSVIKLFLLQSAAITAQFSQKAEEVMPHFLHLKVE